MFALECIQVNAELIFPQTALYELELNQEELYGREKSLIEDACSLLKKYGAKCDLPIPDTLIEKADIVKMFRDVGVKVTVVSATIEDFRDAEKRAALHLDPAPRRKQPSDQSADESDEMRDLVIWAIACRLARENNGAILISRDKVHSGKSGFKEAEDIGLQIAVDLDEALGRLGVATASGKIASALLREAWSKLIEKKLPLPNSCVVNTIVNPSFVQGGQGIESAKFLFTCCNDQGKTFSSKVTVSEMDTKRFKLEMSGIKIDKSNWSGGDVGVYVDRVMCDESDDVAERLDDLRDLIG